MSQNIHASVLRAQIAQANADALIALMAEFGFTLPARTFPSWRPTLREHGVLQGLAENVEILCTDGVLAYFLLPREDGTKELLLGHISSFDGEVSTLHSMPKPPAPPKKEASPKPPKKDPTIVEAVEMLKSLGLM